MLAMTRGEIQDLIGKLANESFEFRRALATDQKGAIQNQLNSSIPECLTVKAVLQVADTAYMVVPHSLEEGPVNATIHKIDECVKMSDLEQLAGGVHAKDEESDYWVGPVKQRYILSAVTSGPDSSN